MFISSNPIRRSPRWMHVVLLICAFVLVPLGVLPAQDTNFDAVGRRLKAAVAAGELTGAQARIMLGALRKTGAKKDQGSDRVKAYLTKVKKDLGALVKAGKITEEDAAKRFAGAVARVKKRMDGSQRAKKASDKKGKQGDWAREYLGKVRKDIGAAVRAGKMSREDAGKKYAAAEKNVKKKMAAIQAKERGAKGKKAPGADRVKVYLTRVRKELGQAVKTGRISKEDAAKRYAAAVEAMKKRMAGSQRGKKAGDKKGKQGDWAREYLGKVRKDIGAAVRAGKMSREDAGKKYAAAEKSVKKKMAAIQAKERGAKGKKTKKAKKSKQPDRDRQKKAGTKKRDSLRQIGIDLANIRKALESGKLSSKDAELKMRAISRRMAAIQRAGKQRERSRL